MIGRWISWLPFDLPAKYNKLNTSKFFFLDFKLINNLLCKRSWLNPFFQIFLISNISVKNFLLCLPLNQSRQIIWTKHNIFTKSNLNDPDHYSSSIIIQKWKFKVVFVYRDTQKFIYRNFLNKREKNLITG